jgi:L-ribulose-5-phosphate 3-epimerase
VSHSVPRRTFLEAALAAVPAGSLVHGAFIRGPWPWSDRRPPVPTEAAPLFRISLAEWSLHRALGAGQVDHLEFPMIAKRDYGIEAVEYVNSFFLDRSAPRPSSGAYFRGRSEDRRYLRTLKQRAADHGVQSLLIMCDGEGAIGDPDAVARTRTVENHFKWVEAARFLGCHSIRVNAQSQGTPEAQRDLAVDGLRRLTEFAAARGINVIVENHGGISSNGAWLASVIRAVGHPRCGTLPDFGNFQIAPGEWYDRYQGVGELMPFAKAVSGKSHDFDAQGNETGTDFLRMLRIVLGAGYRGWVDVEYEGDRLSEPDGIRATKALLERVCDQLAGEYR